MTRSDFPTFSARLIATAEMFDKNLSEALQVLYFEALADMSIDDVTKGIGICLGQSSKFMPKPADIREALTGGPVDQETDSEIAWQEYKKLARKVGGYANPVFEDPILGQALLAVFGGWPQACWTELSQEMWASKRKEFGRVYRVLKTRGVEPLTSLPGQVALDNSLRGYGPKQEQPAIGAGMKQVSEGHDGIEGTTDVSRGCGDR